MTDSNWNSQLHPRGGIGRFVEKPPTAPGLALISDVPENLRSTRTATAVLDAPAVVVSVPWHLRSARDLTPRTEQDNPLMVAFRDAQREYGDTAKTWMQVLEAEDDGPDAVIEDLDIYDTVRDVVGTPHSYGDVDHWTARTAAWRQHALDLLRAEV